MSTSLTKNDLTGVRGNPVVDAAGDRIGTIHKIYLDAESDQPRWLAVDTGTSNTSLVPLADASLDGDTLRVPWARERIDGAPGLGADGQVDSELHRRLEKHYGSGPAKPPRTEDGREFPHAPRADYAPTGIEDTSTGTVATFKRTYKEFSEDNMTDWAASLTYYGLLALFPALIALMSLIGLVGDPEETTKTITDIVKNISASAPTEPFESVAQAKSASGIAFVVGLVLALNAASGYVGAFMRASNVVWETPEGRSFFKLKPLQIFVTLVMVLLLALVLLSVVLTGPVVEAVAGPLGIGDTAVSIWNIAKWPVLLVVVMLMFGVLFHFAPNVKMPSFKWISPGAAFAVIVWIIASALFAIYVANFGSYNKTYGTLGGVVALLVWVWITNCVLLFGMELNKERERNVEMAAGIPRASEEIQLEPRDEPKPKQST